MLERMPEIKKAIAANAYTLTMLAKTAKVGIGTASDILRGKTANPGVGTWARLVAAHDELAGRKDN